MIDTLKLFGLLCLYCSLKRGISLADQSLQLIKLCFQNLFERRQIQVNIADLPNFFIDQSISFKK